MNIITKKTSLSIVALSFFTSVTTTQCMRIKNLNPVKLKLLTSVPNNSHFITTYHFNHETHEAINSAINLFNSKDSHQKNAALKIFSTFVSRPTHTKNPAQQNEIYKIIIDAAMIGMTNDAHHVQREALVVFQVLVEKEYAFESATDAAALGMKSEDGGVRNAAQDLFNALFKKKQAFEIASLAAAAGIKNDAYFTRKDALSLFDNLFYHKQGFEVATQAANDTFLDEKPHMKCLSLGLFKSLVTHNYAFEAAMKTAVIGMDFNDVAVHAQATELFNYLLVLIKHSEENKS